MKHLTSMLDRVANELESRGMGNVAMELDIVANTMERHAALNPKLQKKIVDFLKKNESVSKLMRDAIKNIPRVIAKGIETIKNGPRVASLILAAINRP